MLLSLDKKKKHIILIAYEVHGVKPQKRTVFAINFYPDAFLSKAMFTFLSKRTFSGLLNMA